MSEAYARPLSFSSEYFTPENLYNDFVEIFESTGSTETRIYEDQLRQGYINAGGNLNEWYPKINPIIQAAKSRAKKSCTERGSVTDADLQRPSLQDGLIKIDVSILHTPCPAHVIEKWIPENEVTLLGAHGGSGKSYVAMKIGVHVALGLELGELKVQQGKVLFLSGEDSADILRYRLGRICESMKVTPIALKDDLILLDASDVDAVLFDPNSGGETYPLRWISEFVEGHDIKFVILDNASDLFGGDEIRRKEVRAFIRSLRTKLARPGRAVLLLVHINKTNAAAGRNANSEDYSGSTAWHNSARSRLSLIPEKGGRFTIHHQKANHAPLSDPMVFDWIGGVPVDAALAEQSPEKLAREANLQAQEEERDKADKAALLKLLQDFERRGERVTTSTHGPFTVYKLLSQHNAYPKMIDRQRLMQLLRDLETEGRIRRSAVQTLGRKWREVFSLSGDRAPNQHRDLNSQVQGQEQQ